MFDMEDSQVMPSFTSLALLWNKRETSLTFRNIFVMHMLRENVRTLASSMNWGICMSPQKLGVWV